MAPHGIYPALGEDEWVAIACRNDSDWDSLCSVIQHPWLTEKEFATLQDRLDHQDVLDQHLSNWTRNLEKYEIETALQDARIPVAAVLRPEERIDLDPATGSFGLWPTVRHREMGEVRVDGQPVHFSKTDWQMTHGAPCLSQHTMDVLTRVLGYSEDDVTELGTKGVI